MFLGNFWDTNLFMNLELFSLNGYGQFVWPAFFFTFISCFFLYLKTKKEFHKYEKIFLNEFGQFQTERIEVDKRKKSTKEVLSGSSV